MLQNATTDKRGHDWTGTYECGWWKKRARFHVKTRSVKKGKSFFRVMGARKRKCSCTHLTTPSDIAVQPREREKEKRKKKRE
jgi:hypothetical protein